MSLAPGKALAHLSDKELADMLPKVSEHVIYAYNDVINEIERRRIKAESDRSFRLSLTAVVVAAISLLASVLLAILK